MSKLWVVVPAFNEESGIGKTLDALAAQQDSDFTLLVVDNNSTDGTAAAVTEFAAAHPSMRIELIGEQEKGTGAASDTCMRYAIAAGAIRLARTDADCLPAPDWTARVNAAFDALELNVPRLLPTAAEVLEAEP